MPRSPLVHCSRALVVAGLLAGCTVTPSLIKAPGTSASPGTTTTLAGGKNEPLEPIAGELLSAPFSARSDRPTIGWEEVSAGGKQATARISTRSPA